MSFRIILSLNDLKSQIKSKNYQRTYLQQRKEVYKAANKNNTFAEHCCQSFPGVVCHFPQMILPIGKKFCQIGKFDAEGVKSLPHFFGGKLAEF